MSRATERRRAAAIGAVLLERERQECMKASGRFEFTCADDGMTNAEKLTVLVEEVGEVAQEVLTQDGRRLAHDTVGTPEALLKEVVQVAAVALAWIECLTPETLAAGECCYQPSARRDGMAGPSEEDIAPPEALGSSPSPAASVSVPCLPNHYGDRPCGGFGDRCECDDGTLAAGENETPPSETAQVALSALGLSPAASVFEQGARDSWPFCDYCLGGTAPECTCASVMALETGVRPPEREQSEPAESESPPVSSAPGAELLQRNQHEAACDCAYCREHYPHSDL